MLCCGLLAALAALVAGSWRRLRAARWIALIAGGAALLTIPAMALGTAAQTVSPQSAFARAMQTLCGQTAS